MTVTLQHRELAQRSLDNAADLRAMVDQALNATGGPAKPRERAWARKMISAVAPLEG